MSFKKMFEVFKSTLEVSESQDAHAEAQILSKIPST